MLLQTREGEEKKKRKIKPEGMMFDV